MCLNEGEEKFQLRSGSPVLQTFSPSFFPVFVVRTVSAASEPSLMNVHKPGTQVKVILAASCPQ